MARAAEQHGQPAVLIIDEINRGNLPKLLGELLYALEYRTATVRLPFEWRGRSDLSVPHNLLLIGTMNSSDRSIGHIDVAVRRRFGLIHVAPDPSVVRKFWSEFDAGWGERLAGLMEKINSELGECDRGGELRIGHAYFLANRTLPDLKQQVRRNWLFQVQQLLEEYRNVLNLPDDFVERYSVATFSVVKPLNSRVSVELRPEKLKTGCRGRK
jgi:5-methylcytosine-specific restriction protein B